MITMQSELIRQRDALALELSVLLSVVEIVRQEIASIEGKIRRAQEKDS